MAQQIAEKICCSFIRNLLPDKEQHLIFIFCISQNIMNGGIEQHITACIRLIVSECYHLFHVTFHLLTLFFTVIVDYIFYYFGIDDNFVHAWSRCLHTSHSRTKRKEAQYGKNVQLPYYIKGNVQKSRIFVLLWCLSRRSETRTPWKNLSVTPYFSTTEPT